MSNIVEKDAVSVVGDPGLLLGKLGTLTTRLASDAEEVRYAQRIRHTVFCEEFGAMSPTQRGMINTDADMHDDRCDHLLVMDDQASMNGGIVGTQRFCLRKPGRPEPEFYSQSEFDVASLLRCHPDRVFMELGRSCILPEYRSKRTMELMWQGTWAYAVNHQVDVMIGCASFHESSPSPISEELSFLVSVAGATADWNVCATGEKGYPIELKDPQSFDGKRILKRLPPLVKGYLRLGALFSRHAVVDEEFRTVDVLVVLPVERISARYLKYYGEDASKHRA